MNLPNHAPLAVDDAISAPPGIGERRQAQSRRRYTLRTLFTCLTAPRRTHGRRKADRVYPMLDRFDSGMLTLAILLITLSVLDSLFTLNLLARGGSELNPVMHYVLGYGVWAFAGVKMLLTAVPAVLLVATGNLMLFGRIRARTILAALVGLYLGLIVYELALLSIS